MALGTRRGCNCGGSGGDAPVAGGLQSVASSWRPKGPMVVMGLAMVILASTEEEGIAIHWGRIQHLQGRTTAGATGGRAAGMSGMKM